MAVTNQQIDAILSFLDRFTEKRFTARTWHAPPCEMPWFIFCDSVSEFYQLLYDNNWIDSTFAWTDWEEGLEYIGNPNKVQSADTETIRKLLTAHVRNDRFCTGHLADMFANGHIVALLRRLKDIRTEGHKSEAGKDAST
jgi:hypothetical protein